MFLKEAKASLLSISEAKTANLMHEDCDKLYAEPAAIVLHKAIAAVLFVTAGLGTYSPRSRRVSLHYAKFRVYGQNFL